MADDPSVKPEKPQTTKDESSEKHQVSPSAFRAEPEIPPAIISEHRTCQNNNERLAVLSCRKENERDQQ